jgi:hypothetical protein
MDEQRKHAILLAATLLSARKLIEGMEQNRPNYANREWVDKAIGEAAFILERIDARWPVDIVSERRR